jgi:hypothetical protein
MAASLYEQVISAHRTTLDRLIDRGSAERLKNVYDKAAAEVVRKLESKLGRGSVGFSTHHLHLVLAQLKSGQIYIDDQLFHELGAASREAQVESLRGLSMNFKRLEKKYTGHAPVLPIDEAARFARVVDKGRSSLLRQHRTSIKRYGMEVIDSMQDAMAISLAGGETLDGAISRVHGVMDGEWWRAERVARTETCYAANVTHSDGIVEIAKEETGLMQQWIEFCAPDGRPLDDRVDVDSIAMHGQLTEPGGVFTMPASAPFPNADGETDVPPSLVGKSWAVPPCRPNGRETVQAWKKEWGVPGWKYANGRRVWLNK